MRKLLSTNFWSEYTITEWTAIKVSLVYFWVRVVMGSTIDHDRVPFPSGIFSIINGSFLVSQYTVFVFFICSVVLAILYIAEKWMSITTLLMFLLSLLLFTLEESSGIQNRNSLYTLIFLAQSIAYYRNNTHLAEERIQFPIQIIAGGYMLAGISKLRESGLHWITDAPHVSLQIIKGYCYAYFDTGNMNELQKGEKYANFILQHRFAVQSLLAGSLFLELFAWLAVKNKLRAFVYGFLLLAMHVGIFYFMNILIVAIFYPMLIFMINPLYFLSTPIAKLFKRISEKDNTV
jgi:hypothetical protein